MKVSVSMKGNGAVGSVALTERCPLHVVGQTVTGVTVWQYGTVLYVLPFERAWVRAGRCLNQHRPDASSTHRVPR